MKKIGFKSWGWWGASSSESKWEKSLFGGFRRLITDYPRVVVDFDVDFDFAPVKNLAYFEKDKILKIFLSKSKTRGQIDLLLKNASSVSESSFMYGKVIKTTIDKFQKECVLDNLICWEKEYSPLFEHYRKFIIDSDISFKRPDDDSGDGDGNSGKSKDENKNNEQKNNQQKDKQDQGEDGQGEDSQGEQDNDENQQPDDGQNNEDENQQDEKQSNSKPSSPKMERMSQNIREFENALKNIKEEEYKFNSISDYSAKTIIEIQRPGRDTIYTNEEIMVAENLTKMLDISFDPAEDTVKNLRLGKLDITKIAEVPAGNIAIYKQTVENQTTKPFSVVILCDESASMGHNKIRSQYEIVKSLYLSFSDILPQEKIFVYGHSGKNPELYVYQDAYNQNFVSTIDSMLGRYNRENYDGPIIEEIYKNVRATTNDRIIFIILSDGAPCGIGYGHEIKDIIHMKQIIEKCKRDDFVTVGVGIQSMHVKDIYQYSTIVMDLNEMPKKVSHIVNHVVKTEFQ